MNNRLTNIIFSTAFSGYFQKLIRFLVSIITLPIIISSLGKVEYGIFVLVGQSVLLMSLSDMGISNSIGRFISKYLAIKDADELNNIYNTSIKLLIVVSFLILLITFLISKYIPIWLNIADEYYEISKLLFELNGFFLALTFPTKIGQGILSGKQLYPIINLTNAFLAIVQLIGIIILSYFNILNLIELTLLILIINLLNQLILIYFSLKNTNLYRFDFYSFSVNSAKNIFSLGSSSLLISLSGMLITQGLIIAVGILCGTELAGIFGVIMLIITNISFLLTKFSQPMVTLSSELISSKKQANLNQLIKFVMRISFMMSFFIFISAFFYIDFLLRLLLDNTWNDNDFKIVYDCIILILFCVTIGIPQFVSRAVLQGSGYHWNASIGKIIASLISFLLGIILMKYDFGLIGGAVGVGLVWFLQGVFYFPRLISKFMKIELLDQLTSVYFPVLLIAIFNFSIVFFLRMNFNINNLISFFIIETFMFSTTFLLINVYHKHFDKRYFVKIFNPF